MCYQTNNGNRTWLIRNKAVEMGEWHNYHEGRAPTNDLIRKQLYDFARCRSARVIVSEQLKKVTQQYYIAQAATPVIYYDEALR